MRIMPNPAASLSLDDLIPSQSIELNKQGGDSVVFDYILVSREFAKRNNDADDINQHEKIKRA